MPDGSSDAPPGMRGKIWRAFRAGEGQAGQPLAGWYYVTPRLPAGISRVALARADEVTHHEVAREWFTVNLRPIVLSDAQLVVAWSGGAFIGDGRGGVLAAAPVLNRVDTLQVLTQEFGGTIPEGALRAVATWLGDYWEWLPPIALEGLPPEELRAAALSKLDTLGALLRRLIPQPGEAGHNLPDSELPITRADLADALAAIDLVKAAVAAPVPAADTDLSARWAPVQAVIQKLGDWLGKQIDFATPKFTGAAAPVLGVGLSLIGLVVLARHEGIDIGDLIRLIQAMKPH